MSNDKNQAKDSAFLTAPTPMQVMSRYQGSRPTNTGFVYWHRHPKNFTLATQTVTSARSIESRDAEILELPGIVRVDVGREEMLPAEQRRPLAVDADDVAEIGLADAEDPRVVHLVRLDDAAVRVLDRPDHPGE